MMKLASLVPAGGDVAIGAVAVAVAIADGERIVRTTICHETPIAFLDGAAARPPMRKMRLSLN